MAKKEGGLVNAMTSPSLLKQRGYISGSGRAAGSSLCLCVLVVKSPLLGSGLSGLGLQESYGVPVLSLPGFGVDHHPLQPGDPLP
jgi:hypothetical protein